MDLPEQAVFLFVLIAVYILICSAHQRGVLGNTAYQNDGGLFLHSIAEGSSSRIQIKYPAESHEHDALLPFIAMQVRVSSAHTSPRCFNGQLDKCLA